MKALKDLRFSRLSDGRLFEAVVEDPYEKVRTLLIKSGVDGRPFEHDIVFLSHHDDFISIDGQNRYDLQPPL